MCLTVCVDITVTTLIIVELYNSPFKEKLHDVKVNA